VPLSGQRSFECQTQYRRTKSVLSLSLRLIDHQFPERRVCRRSSPIPRHGNVWPRCFLIVAKSQTNLLATLIGLLVTLVGVRHCASPTI
jgi:hypothetical protein